MSVPHAARAHYAILSSFSLERTIKTSVAFEEGIELYKEPEEIPVFSTTLPDTMRMEPALGKTVLQEDIPKLFADPNGAPWYGS